MVWERVAGMGPGEKAFQAFIDMMEMFSDVYDQCEDLVCGCEVELRGGIAS